EQDLQIAEARGVPLYGMTMSTLFDGQEVKLVLSGYVPEGVNAGAGTGVSVGAVRGFRTGMLPDLAANSVVRTVKETVTITLRTIQDNPDEAWGIFDAWDQAKGVFDQMNDPFFYQLEGLLDQAMS